MSFKFGVSYNCMVDDCCVGGADDYVYSTDMLGNDLSKIVSYVQAKEADPDLKVVFECGNFIGKPCSQGGNVVAYLGYDYDGDGEIYPTIVIYDNPADIEIIE